MRVALGSSSVRALGVERLERNERSSSSRPRRLRTCGMSPAALPAQISRTMTSMRSEELLPKLARTPRKVVLGEKARALGIVDVVAHVSNAVRAGNNPCPQASARCEPVWQRMPSRLPGEAEAVPVLSGHSTSLTLCLLCRKT